jgi:hypothetical protein
MGNAIFTFGRKLSRRRRDCGKMFTGNEIGKIKTKKKYKILILSTKVPPKPKN